jgi:holo-[acyl-carrier protein] synthase
MDVIAHGIDLVEIERIAAMLDEHGERFRERCFTTAEQRYAEAGRRRAAERYAARFACKEAVLKALGTGWRSGIAWTDIGVVNEPSGRPVVTVTGRCGEIARELGIGRWHVSLSHAGGPGGYAMASVIACRG